LSANTAPRPGSIRSVSSVAGGLALVLSGPFLTADEEPEFLCLAVYTGKEPDFRWTHQDVRLEPRETGARERLYVATWNVRPILDSHLDEEVGEISTDLLARVADVYWAAVEGGAIRSKRTGRTHRWLGARAVRRFQHREVIRWKAASGPALTRTVRAGGPGRD
jgi:hypothetical protein